MRREEQSTQDMRRVVYRFVPSVSEEELRTVRREANRLLLGEVPAAGQQAAERRIPPGAGAVPGEQT
jgi:hypothetical protein